MKRKLKGNLLLLVLLFSFFDVLCMEKLTIKGEQSRLQEKILLSREFREQALNSELLELMKQTDNPGLYAGLYLLESKGSFQQFSYPYTKGTMKRLYNKWAVKKEWIAYQKACYAIWNDLKYFPVAKSATNPSLTVGYADSWMHERTFGGKRGHEGTDIMASQNERGIYPVLSMTDGKVTSKGWLPKGGWRIGITAPGGAYFYYAHLDSYGEIEVGDEIKAGEFLGYMGDSGYGDEGTVGQFPVHLHVGIYIKDDEKEISINPYWILKYLEKHSLEYTFS